MNSNAPAHRVSIKPFGSSVSHRRALLLEIYRETKETYLKPRDAAQYLSSSVSTSAKRRMNKQGPNFVRLGRAIRYRQSDLDTWMSSSAAIRVAIL